MHSKPANNANEARMKLHEIQFHFREVPQAVKEHGLRRRPRTRPRPSSPIKFLFRGHARGRGRKESN